MDSLLANYASSNEEEDQKPQLQPPPKPKPSSSSLFSSLPPPKQEPDTKPTSSRSSLFSSLPKPKLEPQHDLDFKPQIPKKSSSSLPQIPKRVVQFKPPVFANPTHLDEDDDDDEEEEQRLRRKAAEASSAQPQSVTSFLSAIPAPRNSSTLGVSSGLGSGVGSGRRAILETKVESAVGLEQNENVGSYDSSQPSFDANGYEGYGGYENYQYGVDHNVDSGVQLQAGVSGSEASSYGGGYGGYSGYVGDHGNGGWANGSQTAVMGMSGDGGVRGGGKRRRNDVPTEILEVKQDELMKNRPREDQAKVIGIAFGPSYQPVSAKGKPTKLHKRKHQIGALYFDMKQKEMELQERRSRGLLTKAETQAKYGW